LKTKSVLTCNSRPPVAASASAKAAGAPAFTAAASSGSLSALSTAV
jgi:hypothetical protein